VLNFPVPYSEELLFSTVARAGIRHGLMSPKQLLDEVFGSRAVIATLDLPNHISAISRWLPKEFTAEKLVYNHTLFPIYALFVPESRRQQCVNLMLGKSQGAVHLALGVAASRVKTPSFIRYCPSCLAEQRNQHGEYFWSREWQVAGIDSCPEHGALIDTRITRPLIERHRFLAASPVYCPIIRAPEGDVISERISCQVRQLFKLPARQSPSFAQWTAYYHDLAYRHGHRRGKSQIDHISINERILSASPTSWLAKYNLIPDVSCCNDSGWLRSMFRKHRKSFSYLQHIIVHQALLGNDWTILKVIERVCRYPINIRLKKIHVAVDINKRLLSDQKDWISLLSSSHSPKQARRQSPALYSRVYRKHRGWLLDVNRRYANDRTGSRAKRVDWNERDRECLQTLQQLATSFRANSQGPRRSKAYFLKMLGAPSTLGKNLYRMPRSTSFLLANVEGVEQYQIRRLQNTFDKLRGHLGYPPRWRLLRNAKLSEERLKPGAKKYLDALVSN
jgi:hypothetical protein